MVKRPIIHGPRLWLKWSVLFASWWVLGVLIVLISAPKDELSTLHPDVPNPGLGLRPSKNTIYIFCVSSKGNRDGLW